MGGAFTEAIDGTIMTDLVTGRQPVLEAIKSGRGIEKIFLQYGIHGESISRIKRLAKQHSIPVVEVDRARFLEIAPDASAQGVAALFESTRYEDVETILKAASDRGEPPFLLILDEIEDPHNMGALIRTAECAGVHGVVIPRHHSASVNETVVKASSGATFHLPIAKVANIASTLEELKKAGVWIVGTAADGDRALYDADYKGAIAVVVGNEGRGMRRLVKERCDFLVRIPLYGKLNSLNASVAGALVMFEAARARYTTGKRLA
jgi:23S rRNA (guanosine2251-2'-O)-methyltransferase